MNFRGALIILGDEAVQDLREKAALFRAKAAHDPEVDGHEAGVPRIDEQIALMHVCVEETIANRMLQERADDVKAERLAVDPGRVDGGEIAQRDRVDPVQGENALAGALPVHVRHAEAEIAGFGDVLGHLGNGGRLQAQIHLQHNRLRKRIHRGHGAKTPCLRRQSFRSVRREVEALKIAFEPFFDVRAEDLDGDGAQAAFRPHRRLVHLRDRGCGERRAEIGVDFIPGPPESGLDLPVRLPDRKWRKPVAQRAESVRQMRPDHIGTGRQELAELDVGWPERSDRPGKPLPLGFALCRRFFVGRPAQNAQWRRQRDRVGHKPGPVPSERRAGLGQTVRILDCVEHSRVEELHSPAD